MATLVEDEEKHECEGLALVTDLSRTNGISLQKTLHELVEHEYGFKLTMMAN